MKNSTKTRPDRLHYLEEELTVLMQKPEMIAFLDEGALDGMWYWDLEAPEHEYISPGFWRALGFDPSERQHLAAEWQNLIYPEDRDLALENFQRHLDNPNHPYDQLVRYKSKSGGTVTVRCRGLAIRENGQPRRMFGVHTILRDSSSVETDRQLSELISLSPDAVLAWSSSQGIVRWNRGAECLYGVKQAEARGALPHELTRAEFPGGWETVERELASGRVWSGEVKRYSREGSTLITSTNLSLIERARGDLLILEIDRDVTADYEREENLRLLNRELNHRVKNLFAVVQSLIAMSSKGETDLPAVIDKIKSRVGALATANVISIDEEETQPVSLVALLRSITAPYGHAHDHLTFDGDDFALPARSTTPISMIFHELATNAVKYGAWSREEGTVLVRWAPVRRAGSEGRIRIVWKENISTEDLPVFPVKPGFGRRLIGASVDQLGGTIEENWSNVGLELAIELNLGESFESQLE